MLNELRELLRKYGLKPRKHLGQNFLINKDILSEIIKAADLNKNDTVLEIGPGLGILTKELAKKVKKVIAIEKDEKLVKILKKELSHLKDVEIVEGDALQLTTDDLKLHTGYSLLVTGYKLVANLPYYITSPVIRKFLEEGNPPPSAKVSTFVKTSADRSGGRPKLMVLMVQKEVAERICAKPPDMSLLSVAVQFYSQAKIVKIVKKECFWPRPKVDSAIIKLTTNNRQLTTINTNLFFKIVKSGFSQPRKQLKNNLKKIFGKDTEKILKQSKIETTRRAETLSIDEWLKICLNYKNRLK